MGVFSLICLLMLTILSCMIIKNGWWTINYRHGRLSQHASMHRKKIKSSRILDNHLVLLLDIRSMDMDIILMRCTCWCHTFSWCWSTCSTTHIPIEPVIVAPRGFPKGQQDLSLPHIHESLVAPDVWEGEVEKIYFYYAFKHLFYDSYTNWTFWRRCINFSSTVRYWSA